MIVPINGPCDKNDRWGIALWYGHHKMPNGPHRFSAIELVSRSGDSHKPPIKNPILAKTPLVIPMSIPIITPKGMK